MAPKKETVQKHLLQDEILELKTKVGQQAEQIKMLESDLKAEKLKVLEMKIQMNGTNTNNLQPHLVLENCMTRGLAGYQWLDDETGVDSFENNSGPSASSGSIPLDGEKPCLVTKRNSIPEEMQKLLSLDSGMQDQETCSFEAGHDQLDQSLANQVLESSMERILVEHSVDLPPSTDSTHKQGRVTSFDPVSDQSTSTSVGLQGALTQGDHSLDCEEAQNPGVKSDGRKDDSCDSSTDSTTKLNSMLLFNSCYFCDGPMPCNCQYV